MMRILLVAFIILLTSLFDTASGQVARREREQERRGPTVAEAPIDALKTIHGLWEGRSSCEKEGEVYVSLELGMPVWVGHQDEWSRLGGGKTRAERYPNRRQFFVRFYETKSNFLEPLRGWAKMVEGVEVPWGQETIELLESVPPRGSIWNPGRRNSNNAGPARVIDIVRKGGDAQVIVYRSGCQPFELVRTKVELVAGMPVPGRRPQGLFKASDFKGLSPWIEALQKSVDDPDGYDRFIAGLRASAERSESALTVASLTGARRSHDQRFLTDLAYYRAYRPKMRDLLAAAKQCTGDREYTAAEACDCMAGFPGDTTIGMGAGELVVQANKPLVIYACEGARQGTENKALQARFVAQKARAQLLSPNQATAGASIREAVKGGYVRAEILFPIAELHFLQERSSALTPPLTAQEMSEIAERGAGGVRHAQKLGIREASIVAEQWRQMIARMEANIAFNEQFFQLTFAPTPDAGPCNSKCQAFQIQARREENALEWASRKPGRDPSQYTGN